MYTYATLVALAALVGTAQCFTGPSLSERVPRALIVPEHSFVPPLLSSPWASAVDHWEFGLSTVVTNAHVRLTAALQSREGYMWNTEPNRLASWTAHVGFRVHSKQSLGGDGFAIWLRDKRYRNGGPLIGTPNAEFRGLGVVFDSFDNDGRRDNPAVHVLYGAPNAPITLSTSTDFENEKIGGCVVDFRNTAPESLIEATIAYDAPQQRLTVSLHKNEQPVQCATADGVELPPGFYFGLTAHTGGVDDNHDVAYFALVSNAAEDAAEGGAQGGADDGMV
jgi:mannose-binding lectin 1